MVPVWDMRFVRNVKILYQTTCTKLPGVRGVRMCFYSLSRNLPRLARVRCLALTPANAQSINRENQLLLRGGYEEVTQIYIVYLAQVS